MTDSITKQRIRDHFSRMWIIYIAGVLIVLFLNHILFTVTRPSYSDDETLKIMLLNAEAEIDTESLLASLSGTGIQSVRTEPLSGADISDPTSVMMLSAKLISGFGDIYITDAAGLTVLQSRAACLDLSDMEIPGTQPVPVTHPETGETYPGALQTGNGLLLVIPYNSTNIPQAKTALPILTRMITE